AVRAQVPRRGGHPALLADPARAALPDSGGAGAGRIRRLLAMADKRAQDLGIPGTESNLTEELAEGMVG
ncbi:hypothetical protein ABT366_30085, partial [Streptomyces lydicus]